MLSQLRVKNFILIEEMDISFDEGFSSLTGETGAGKSIFLGALSLLQGKRAEVGLIRSGSNKCIIEGSFVQLSEKVKLLLRQLDLTDDDEPDADNCIIRREISTTGKNRCFINDIPVQLSRLADISEYLIDIHSQHSNLLLGNPEFILQSIDQLLPDGNLPKEYKKRYLHYTESLQQLTKLKKQINDATQALDYDSFRLNELNEAQLTIGEEENLADELKRLQHADDIKAALFETEDRITRDEQGLLVQLNSMLKQLQRVQQHIPDLENIVARIASCQIELKDVCSEVQNMGGSLNADPGRLMEVESRLDRLNKLFDKFHVNSSEKLVALREELNEKIALYNDSSHLLEAAQEQFETSKKELLKTGKRLTKAREKVGNQIAERIVKNLSLLEIPHACVQVQIESSETPLANGLDKVILLFSANSNMPPQPIGSIASGGEISRVMLSLKAIIAEHANMPTILFDEIDTGISGRVADRMGHILRSMGLHMQVIAITHLPQIAARAQHQLMIQKTQTLEGLPTSNIQKLNEDERKHEVARLISGDKITDTSLQAAAELLKAND